MLYYIDQDWDKNLTVIETVLRLIRMFGAERCFFASNYPVDIQKGWPAHRLFPALRRLYTNTPSTRAELAWRSSGSSLQGPLGVPIASSTVHG